MLYEDAEGNVTRILRVARTRSVEGGGGITSIGEVQAMTRVFITDMSGAINGNFASV